MLVLSRKKNQSIVFPNLGITVEIVQIDSNRVKVGIEAPRNIDVVRGEIADADELLDAAEAEKRRKHDFRSKLNGVTLALHLLQRQLNAGMTADANETLARAMRMLTNLDKAAEKSEATGEAEVSTGLRALVIEDNANEREVLAGFLRVCGYEVDTVRDGIDAMLYLEKHDTPHVVLLDMQMPRMDGSKTIDLIRSNPRYADLKVFAVSGSEREAMGVSLGPEGVNGWFEKPLKPARFAEELQRCCTE